MDPIKAAEIEEQLKRGLAALTTQLEAQLPELADNVTTFGDALSERFKQPAKPPQKPLKIFSKQEAPSLNRHQRRRLAAAQRAGKLHIDATGEVTIDD